MTETSISLLSILVGIISANLYAYISKNNFLGFTGNTIIGVFGSILFIKSFGRLGFAPNHIVIDRHLNLLLFIVNMMVSALGGILGLLLALKIKK
ncbi:hypothetical protein [Wenyingzhuangia sp. IMCC45467]